MPKGIYERKQKAESEIVPRETFSPTPMMIPEKQQPVVAQPKKVRKVSDETDRKGPSHPLCMNCGHREDMHHAWQNEQVLEGFRDVTGRVSQRWTTVKHPVYDGQKPCQHACKCTEYE